ncbi:MAG: hypothetical protein U1F43_08565 [Myxococcota bacterium]
MGLTLVAAAACGTTPVSPTATERPDVGPSIVEYVPLRKAARAPTTPAPATIVRVDDDDNRESATSTLHYESIAMDTPPPDSPRVVPPIEDDVAVGHPGARPDRDDHADHADADDDVEPGDADDLAQEDRATPTAPAHETVVAKANQAVDASIYDPRVLENGLVVPYPLNHVFRGFGPCVGRRHVHEAIDIGGVGPNWGIGTPIHAMARSEVVFIGTGDGNPDDFGLPDRRAGEAQRGDRLLPRGATVAPYGEVHFFTRKKGRWRSGNILVTRVVDGPLAGHTIRYLHVAAVHPDLHLGSVVEAGQEIAIIGGTGVQDSAPHLHLDITAPDGHRLDVAPLLGLAPTASCKNRPAEEALLAHAHADHPPVVRPAARHDVKVDRRPAPRGDAREHAADDSDKDGDAKILSRGVAVPHCGAFSQREDFGSGKYKGHAVVFEVQKGDRFAVELVRRSGNWKPKLDIDAPASAVKVQWLGTGKAGKRAYAVIEARKELDLKVGIGAWDKEPPTKAGYQLNVAERCVRRAR